MPDSDDDDFAETAQRQRGVGGSGGKRGMAVAGCGLASARSVPLLQACNVDSRVEGGRMFSGHYWLLQSPGCDAMRQKAFPKPGDFDAVQASGVSFATCDLCEKSVETGAQHAAHNLLRRMAVVDMRTVAKGPEIQGQQPQPRPLEAVRDDISRPVRDAIEASAWVVDDGQAMSAMMLGHTADECKVSPPFLEDMVASKGRVLPAVSFVDEDDHADVQIFMDLATVQIGAALDTLRRIFGVPDLHSIGIALKCGVTGNIVQRMSKFPVAILGRKTGGKRQSGTVVALAGGVLSTSTRASRTHQQEHSLERRMRGVARRLGLPVSLSIDLDGKCPAALPLRIPPDDDTAQEYNVRDEASLKIVHAALVDERDRTGEWSQALGQTWGNAMLRCIASQQPMAPDDADMRRTVEPLGEFVLAHYWWLTCTKDAFDKHRKASGAWGTDPPASGGDGGGAGRASKVARHSV